MRLQRWLLALLLTLMAMPVAADMKIGVVDLRQAVFSSKAAEDFSMLLQGQMQEDEERVRQARDEAQQLQRRLESDGAMMSDSERQRLESEFQQKAQRFQQLQGQFEQAVTQRQQQFIQQASPLVDAAMEEILEERDLDMILPSEAVIYVRPDYDLTEELIERLNAEVE